MEYRSSCISIHFHLLKQTGVEIMIGTDNDTQADDDDDSFLKQSVLTVSKLIGQNSYIRQRKQSKNRRCNPKRETPLAIYVGLLVHAKTRKRDLVDKLYRLGLSISYDRVMAISTQLAHKVCNQFTVAQ